MLQNVSSNQTAYKTLPCSLYGLYLLIISPIGPRLSCHLRDTGMCRVVGYGVSDQCLPLISPPPMHVNFPDGMIIHRGCFFTQLRPGSILQSPPGANYSPSSDLTQHANLWLHCVLYKSIDHQLVRLCTIIVV